MKLQLRGKIHYIRYSETRRRSLHTSDLKLAKRILKAEQDALRNSKVVSLTKQKKLPLSDFTDEYLNMRESDDISHKTYLADEYALTMMRNAIGNIPMRLIKRDTVEDYKSACKANKLQESSINITMRHLKAAFNDALRKKYIERNPFVKEHKHDRVFFDLGDNLPRFFKVRELKLLISVIADPRDYLIINMYFYTGMRRAELLNLKIADIDLDDGDGAVYITNKTKKTKTKKERAVPINPHFKPMLAYYLRKCDGSACVDILQSVEAALDEYGSFCLKEFKRIRPLKKAHDIGPHTCDSLDKIPH